MNNRLKPLAEKILPETQTGFRPVRGTTDMIFILRQLQEKCHEQYQPLYMAFIDLTKAFDSVKYGCVIAPTLFIIFIATILHIIKDDLPSGIEIVYRTQGKLFNLAGLKSKTKTCSCSLIEFQYADDNSTAAFSEEDLQRILNAFNKAYISLGLTINSKKTQILYQPSPNDPTRREPSIKLGEISLENVDHFPYLGSHLSSNLDLSDEIQHRLKCAGTAFGRLRNRIFQDHDIRTDTKMAVYNPVVIPTLLYASETWTTYRRHLDTSEKFHQRCLRSILNISWEDRRTNVSVLKAAKATSIEAHIIKSQLRWSGHVVRMSDDRLPKQIFYSLLKEGNRKKGRQTKRYKDLLKANMKECNIDFNNWEENARWQWGQGKCSLLGGCDDVALRLALAFLTFSLRWSSKTVWASRVMERH
ncbi:uncharacterized protein LOC143040564 [Oratosquilla oratoria]|uniref:uncharacterized protein LOC143040564 n=1 Tax=Oratosquilla oratoria TaxID=337810 RepID=UPI003F76758B